VNGTGRESGVIASPIDPSDRGELFGGEQAGVVDLTAVDGCVTKADLIAGFHGPSQIGNNEAADTAGGLEIFFVRTSIIKSEKRPCRECGRDNRRRSFRCVEYARLPV